MFKKIILPVGIAVVVFTFTFFLINSLINMIVEIVKKTFLTGNILKPEPLDIGIEMIYSFRLMEVSLIYVGIGIISLVATGVALYKLKTNFSDLKKGQKGTSRFTTLDELKKQYRAIPEKVTRFDGGGGVPVSRYKNKIFIDDNPVNNLWIGTTRSGKGEIGVFPMIDIYSRARKQASMVLNDPKGELFATSKEPLEKLGYHVEVLNLMNPMESMSYNLLQMVIESVKEEDFSSAQQHARSIGFMLYFDPSAKDKFWQESSISLCSAIILAVCDKCINEGTEEKITMYAVANMLNDLGTKPAESDEYDDALDEYFSKLSPNNVAKMQYATANFSKGVTRGGIFANTSAQLGIFTLDGIAKLTSMDSFNMKKLGFGKWIKGKATPLTRLSFKFSNGKTNTIKTDVSGRFTLYFNEEIKINEVIEISMKTGNEEIKTEVLLLEKEENEGVVTFSQDNSEFITVEALMDFTKPVAIFMIVPDYDATLHVIASLFVKQVYTDLAKTSSSVSGGKCFREVVFILDEFGNMPAIEGLANMVTVCLGRNIRFNLVIQAYSQLETLYGEQWKTIDGNCGNTIYLLTADNTTAEAVSVKMGEETITTKSRSGTTLSLDKSKTESVDSRRLLTASEVMGLQEGEMLVVRVIKRQDNERKKITSYPIFSTGETRMKYRYEYLGDIYDNSKSINDLDIECKHVNVNLDKLLLDFNTEENPNEHEQKSEETQEKSIAADVKEADPTPVKKSEAELPFEEIPNEMTVREIFGRNQYKVIEGNILPQFKDEDGEKQTLDFFMEMNILEFLDITKKLVLDNTLDKGILSLLIAKAKDRGIDVD